MLLWWSLPSQSVRRFAKMNSCILVHLFLFRLVHVQQTMTNSVKSWGLTYTLIYYLQFSLPHLLQQSNWSHISFYRALKLSYSLVKLQHSDRRHVSAQAMSRCLLKLWLINQIQFRTLFILFLGKFLGSRTWAPGSSDFTSVSMCLPLLDIYCFKKH